MVSDANDRGQLVPMARGAQAALGGGALTVVADTGYAQAEGAHARRRGDHGDRAAPGAAQPLAPRFARARFGLRRRGRHPAIPVPPATLSFCCEVRGQRRYTTPACGERRGAQGAVHLGASARSRAIATRTISRRWTPARAAIGLDGSRRATGEHPFGNAQAWPAGAPVPPRGDQGVRGEMALSVMAYNLKRLIGVLGVEALPRVCAVAPERLAAG
ncbi:MAG: hypothetical protein U5K43_10360 [Halofilum sp. (in: g-proteobacteria)]|nr:hypothetical protein [Halofilum sp. (in: g-proteobacteria)]